MIDPKPLIDWVDRHPDAVEGWYVEKSPHANAQRSLNRMRKGERPTFLQADQICCELGIHMSQVPGWEKLYWTARCDDLKEAA